jgi:hypothetical protein
MDVKTNNAVIVFMSVMSLALVIEIGIGVYAWYKGYNYEGIAAHCVCAAFGLGLCMMLWVLANLEKPNSVDDKPSAKDVSDEN